MNDIENSKNSAAPPSAYAPGAWRTIKRASGDVYDHIALVSIASAIWFTVVVPPTFVAILVIGRKLGAPLAGLALLVWAVFIVGPALAGIFYLASNIVKREDPAVSDIITGSRLFLTASWKLAAAQLLIAALLATDVAIFFIRAGSPLCLLLSVISLYALAVWVVISVYQWPLLVEQRQPTLKIIYRSFLLVADNPSFTCAIVFVIILLTILCAFPPWMALLYMGACSVTATHALRELFKKYGIVEVRPDVVEDSAWHIGDYR